MNRINEKNELINIYISKSDGLMDKWKEWHNIYISKSDGWTDKWKERINIYITKSERMNGDMKWT